MHFVIMGCGRVGARLATTLDSYGHSVAVIDSEPKAFSRLPVDFSGRRVTGLGIDKDALRQAGIKDAYAFAAVSNGDNTNIISARVAREIFGVQRVVARIYDPTRAHVYERLGIPTVATVQRTTESVLRRLMPPSSDVTWTHPTGLASLATVTPVSAWYGVPFSLVEELAGERIAFVSRLGSVMAARTDFIIQEHDQLYFAIDGQDDSAVKGIMTRAPQLED